MTELLPQIAAEIAQNSAMELAAVILAIAYLLLAVRQNIACWYAAFVSTCLFLVIFWQVNLYMESALQVYYLVMAVYGWYQWRGTNQTNQTNQSSLKISRWPVSYHVIAIAIILIATLISGTLLSDTSQRLAYLDSFTTWGAVVTTYMVTRKILENWVYWLVLDALSIFLYLDRALYFTALLFAVYIIIVCVGFMQWRGEYNRELSLKAV